MRFGLAFGLSLVVASAVLAEATPVARQLCVHVLDTRDLSPLPESRIVLHPVQSSAATGASEVWLPSGAPPVDGWTDADGTACFETLPPGHYLPQASQDGFWDARVGPIRVSPAGSGRLEIRMSLPLQWAGDVIAVLGGPQQPPVASPRPEASPRRLCVVVRDETRALLPGVLVALRSAIEPETDPEVEWKTCLRSVRGSCGALERVTDVSGSTCFDALRPGLYRARTQLDGFWDVEIGPVRVPVHDFDSIELPIVLDALRSDDSLEVVRWGHHWPQAVSSPSGHAEGPGDVDRDGAP